MLLRAMNAILDKLYIKQWNIGLARADIKTILSNGQDTINYTWLPVKKDTRFYADPFIFHDHHGNLNVIYEDFSAEDQYGKISYATLNKDFTPSSSKELLDTKLHLSYPSVFIRDGKTYIIPEASKGGDLISYEFDFEKKQLVNPHILIKNVPLLDSTILEHKGKFWVFATHRGLYGNSKLYLYYADDWKGPYTPHPANPVKSSINGTRPAGNFFSYNGEIYRPTQNCKKYYGKSISINKITQLDTETFSEEPVLTLRPPKNTNFNYAIHTINFSGDVIVIDGLRRIFNPLEQIKSFLLKKARLPKMVYPLVNLYTTNEYFLPQVTWMLEV